MLKVRPKLKVLIVDDSELNREMLGSMLGNEYEILEAENGAQAVEILREHISDLSLILLDVQMPQMDGLEVLIHMNQSHWIDSIPVVMISSETAPKFIERAYDLGATDYIARPYNTMIVRRRVANVILSFAKQRQLMEIITQQISKKEKDNRLMLSILSHIVEFRNGESGLHVLHINIITELLLRQLMLKTDCNKMTYEDITMISMASALHDIGKIAIPEEILNKPGRLTAEEFQIMQGHSMAGAEILMDLPIDRNEPLLKTAYEICRWHHERYDGSGYPDGLKGDAIPLSAQVVALADVYDALTSERCYKPAYSHDTAMKMIFDGQCGVFHPLLLECLRDIGDTLAQELLAQNTLETENAPKETSHISEQLQRYGLGATERLLQQRSYEQQRFRFLSDKTEEIFFNYSVESSILSFNKYGAERFNIESDLFHPLENEKLPKCADSNILDHILEKVRTATPLQPDFQVDVPLAVNQEIHWFRCLGHVIWTNENRKRHAGVLGKLINIDEKYIPATNSSVAAAKPSIESLINGIHAKKETDYCSISGIEARILLQYLKTVFDVVRLVDASQNCQVDINESGAPQCSDFHCYGIWNKDERCENCISAKCMSNKGSLTKFEFIDQNIYHVRATYVEVDGYPYSLEIIDQITEKTLLGGHGKDEIIKYITAYNHKLYVDILTGTYNRRYYEEQLRDMYHISAVAMLDMDHFKSINDTYGHPAGDRALRQVAVAIKNCVRKADYVVRFGGDEFLIVFREIPFHMLPKKLEAIRSCVKNVILPDYPQLQFSISIGGVYGPGKTSDLMNAADTLLYQAKREKAGVRIECLASDSLMNRKGNENENETI